MRCTLSRKRIFLSYFFYLLVLTISFSFVSTFEQRSHQYRGNERIVVSRTLTMRLKKAPRPINVLGKGFGKKYIIPKYLSNAITLTDPGQARKLEGHYKRLIEKQAALFSDMKDQQDQENYTVSDIYARSEISSRTLYIGRIIHSSKRTIGDSIKSLEILLTEYAKTFQPVELGSMLLIGYPQLFYASGYSTHQIQLRSLNLTRYYHFNKNTQFFDYTEIGFEPATSFPTTGVMDDEALYDLYCDDEGRVWSIEEIEARQSQQGQLPIYEKRGRRDIHGMMDRLLDFSSLLSQKTLDVENEEEDADDTSQS